MFNSSFPRPEPLWMADDWFGEPQVIEGIVLYSFEERRVIRFCIEPYGRFPGHTLECEQEFTVIAGSGTLYTIEFDDVISELVTPGDRRIIPTKLHRSIHAEESGLVIETPWKGE